MKIAIGLSGGVDSAVAAYLLKNQGAEVLGINLILTGNEDTEDVKSIASFLKIETAFIDLREYFRETVIENFKNEYSLGKTPSPCIICNEKIKFGKMLSFALERGCDKLATGHYAKVVRLGEYNYIKKAESKKDQSYFLYRLNQEQLSRIVFPLEGLTKEEIRKIAVESGIPVAHKKDSLDICFIPNGDYVSFLHSNGAKSIEGDFINTSGEVIGRHKGIINYTVGQRKGLGAFGRPMFVTKINALQNTVTLGEANEQYSLSLLANNAVFTGQWPEHPFEALIKVRYTATAAPGLVTPTGDGFRVDFHAPMRWVAPGQSAVIYDSEGMVLGGGEIRC